VPRRQQNMQSTAAPEATTTFRTSVGDFTFRSAQFGCRLEIKIGKVRRVLGTYGSEDAAVLGVRNRRTGFQSWDGMGRTATAIQVDTEARWGKNGGTR